MFQSYWFKRTDILFQKIKAGWIGLDLGEFPFTRGLEEGHEGKRDFLHNLKSKGRKPRTRTEFRQRRMLGWDQESEHGFCPISSWTFLTKEITCWNGISGSISRCHSNGAKVQKQIRKLLNSPCLRRWSLTHSIDRGVRREEEKSPGMELDSQRDSRQKGKEIDDLDVSSQGEKGQFEQIGKLREGWYC